MSSLHISISDSLQAFVDAQVAAGKHRSAGEYVRKLLRDAKRLQTRRDVDAKLLEGVRARRRTMTARDWKALEDRVLRRRGGRDARATDRRRD